MSYTEEEVREAMKAFLKLNDHGEVQTRGLYYSTDNFLGDVLRRLKKQPVITAQQVARKINAIIRFIGVVPVADEGTLEGAELVITLDNGQRFRISVTDLGSKT